jgi:hypothetical protein
MEKFSTFYDSFKFFNYVRDSENEYYSIGERIGIIEEKVPTGRINTFELEGLVESRIELDNGRNRTIVKKEAIDRFHPNKIDNKEFWVECRKHFPLLSVCGGESKTIEDANQQTLEFSKYLGLLTFLKDYLIHSNKVLSVLEIGYGYGNLFFDIKDICHYYGIDYVQHDSLKQYHNFIEIKESGIPDFFLNENLFDAVYCANVLQHCSQFDRFVYFKQAYESLKRGGYFLFTEFVMTEENKNSSCWGLIDEKGRGYTQFFNQLTECDHYPELCYVLLSLGFKIVKASMGYENCLSMIVQK